MKTKTRNRRQSGFSLIELLTVVSIIGVIAAIALPHIGSISDEAKRVGAQRNAQNIMMAYSTGAAAGVVWPATGDVSVKVAAVIAGQNPPKGVFATTLFKSSVAADAAAATYPFIGKRTNGDLFYDSAGGQNPTGH